MLTHIGLRLLAIWSLVSHSQKCCVLERFVLVHTTFDQPIFGVSTHQHVGRSKIGTYGASLTLQDICLLSRLKSTKHVDCINTKHNSAVKSLSLPA